MSEFVPSDCSVAQGDLSHEAPAFRLPSRAARQLPDQSTTISVGHALAAVAQGTTNGIHELDPSSSTMLL
jgi:hypothetical protein